jgi:hypothetical protein
VKLHWSQRDMIVHKDVRGQIDLDEVAIVCASLKNCAFRIGPDAKFLEGRGDDG